MHGQAVFRASAVSGGAFLVAAQKPVTSQHGTVLQCPEGGREGAGSPSRGHYPRSSGDDDVPSLRGPCGRAGSVKCQRAFLVYNLSPEAGSPDDPELLALRAAVIVAGLRFLEFYCLLLLVLILLSQSERHAMPRPPGCNRGGTLNQMHKPMQRLTPSDARARCGALTLSAQWTIFKIYSHPRDLCACAIFYIRDKGKKRRLCSFVAPRSQPRFPSLRTHPP